MCVGTVMKKTMVHAKRHAYTCLTITALHVYDLVARMAARHLQKLRAQDVVPLNGVEDGSSDSEEESPGPLNPFDLLDDTEVRRYLLSVFSNPHI